MTITHHYYCYWYYILIHFNDSIFMKYFFPMFPFIADQLLLTYYLDRRVLGSFLWYSDDRYLPYIHVLDSEPLLSVNIFRRSLSPLYACTRLDQSLSCQWIYSDDRYLPYMHVVDSEPVLSVNIFRRSLSPLYACTRLRACIVSEYIPTIAISLICLY